MSAPTERRSGDGQGAALTTTQPGKELAILTAIWGVMKEHHVTYDGAIRVAVMLIDSCAGNSGSREEAFGYAKRLLDRVAARQDEARASA